jgi:hypothetical protein
MASVVTTEFVGSIHVDDPPFTLIEQQSLLSRLIQAIGSAASDFSSDPRSYLRNLLWSDTKDQKRRKRIYLGLAGALVLHIALLVFIAVIGWRTVFVKNVEPPPPEYTVIFPDRPRSIDAPAIEHGVANKPETPKGDAGGGGGGQHTLLPPSKGLPPPMVPLPQIVSMNPSNIPEPSLPVSPTVVGPISPPPPPGPIGDPTGKSGEFSGGPGNAGGIGRGDGTGVGGGKDSGTGLGSRGSRGGGPAGSTTGPAADGVVDFREVSAIQGYKTWSWIRRQTAIITPEAQENKVIGTVVLRATFNADGTITDIQIAMPVQYMSESAKDALRRSTFHPATVFGKPITVRNVLIRIDVHY